MEVPVYTLKGKKKGTVQLPAAFETPFRPDLIRRAVTAARANRRKPYGAYRMAGMMHSVETWGKGRGVARVQRIKDSRRGAESPNNVGGRRAFPPLVEKVWKKAMNRKERRMARLSALAAVAVRDMVEARGHRFKKKLSLPVVVEDRFEETSRTRDAVEVLEKLGVYGDVMRAREGKKVRPGRGKRRGRRYKIPKSILVVVREKKGVERALRNLPGVDVVDVSNLNTELLAPGGDPGRLTLFTKGAIEEIGKW